MNLEDAYYYYKYIINGEEFKPTSIYARENKKPEELIGGKYDPDWTNRNTRQPFAQAEPPRARTARAGPDESRQRDVPREKRRAKKRMDKEQYIKARREQKVRITDGDNEAIEASFPEAAMGRAIKAGKGAREALIQKALPSKEPRDEMIESDSDNEGGAPPPGPPPPPPPPPGPKTPPLQPQPGPSQPPDTVARPSAPQRSSSPRRRPAAPPPPPEPQAGPSRPPEVVAAEAVAVAAARAVLERVPVAVQAQLANAGIEIAPRPRARWKPWTSAGPRTRIRGGDPGIRRWT
eukprot:tig00021332_g20359.t1